MKVDQESSLLKANSSAKNMQTNDNLKEEPKVDESQNKEEQKTDEIEGTEGVDWEWVVTEKGWFLNSYKKVPIKK